MIPLLQVIRSRRQRRWLLVVHLEARQQVGLEEQLMRLIRVQGCPEWNHQQDHQA